ncbi:MAG: hypothetical protein KIH64_017215 [Mycobacterium sp.]|nr:hypothetical protein [Mycobacterium sp.]
MHVKPRSYLTAGVAVLGAGAIALSPIQPIPNQIALAPQHHVVSDLAIDLAATVNPIAAWVDTVKATTANSVTLLKFYLQDPFPLAKTLVANQVTYLKELLSGNADLIFPQIKANLQTLFQAPLDPGNTGTLANTWEPPSEITIPLGTYLSDTKPPDPANPDESNLSPFALNITAAQLVAGLSQAGQPDPLWDAAVQFSSIWRFLNNHLSGLLLGAVGPLVSPVVSLINSVKAFGADLKARQFLSAAFDIINIPANLTNAVLNGAGFTDLTKIINKIAGGAIPDGIKVGVNMGGLLNSMPVNGSLADPDNPPTEYSGGAGFDGLALDIEGFETKFPGLPNGLGGAMVGMGQFLAEKLKVTPPAARTSAAVKPAAAAAALDASAAETAVADEPAAESAPAVAAPSHRKARVAAANDGGKDRAGGNSRSARSSR